METIKCLENAVKIKEYKIRRADRGQVIALPTVWTDDLNLSPGDKIEVFRTFDDRLILVANKKASS